MSGQKGMMMCERPGPSGLDAGPGPKPFLPSSSPAGMEPPGLVPTHKAFPPSLALKPENIPARNKALLHELEDQKRHEALREDEARLAAAAKAESVAAFNAQLRAAILKGGDVSFWRATKRTDGTASASVNGAPNSTTSGSPPAAAVDQAAMQSFVDELLKEATGAVGGTAASPSAPSQPQRADRTVDASTSAAGGESAATPRSGGGGSRKGRAGGTGQGGSKPAWALSSDEAAKLEDDEEAELLQFADELDFDAFMAALDDAEVQETVSKAMQGEDGQGPAPGGEKAWKRQLVAAMNHAAMKRIAAARSVPAAAGDDGDRSSVAAGSEGGATALSRAAAASRARAELASRGDRGWDASTRASDDVARMDRAKAATQEAADFLRENPELRAIHSSASVRAMLQKSEAAGAAAAGAAAS